MGYLELPFEEGAGGAVGKICAGAASWVILVWVYRAEIKQLQGVTGVFFLKP